MTVLSAAARATARAALASQSDSPSRAAVRALTAGPVRWRRWVAAVGLATAVLTAGVAASGSVTNPTCAVNGGVVFDADLEQILATIRHFESRNTYTARARLGTASGAYQFIDSSWANYGGYPSAWMAPPELQDAKAAEWVRTILTNNPNDVPAVPVTWYIGHVPDADSADWDTIPKPEYGNTLTPRQYQTHWMAYYADPTARGEPAATAQTAIPDAGPTCTGVVGAGDYRIPDSTVRLVGSNISWGGYENGRIPLGAMRYSPNSNYLHPSASTAWDQLHAAALEAGFDLTGNGYRPRSAGGETAGTSNHGWGLAIDVSVLVIDSTNPATVHAAFASDEYQWLTANAPLYGWLNPDWAKPVALGGTGVGGWVGEHCCFLEPWHWEWAAFMNLHASAAA